MQTKHRAAQAKQLDFNSTTTSWASRVRFVAAANEARFMKRCSFCRPCFSQLLPPNLISNKSMIFSADYFYFAFFADVSPTCSGRLPQAILLTTSQALHQYQRLMSKVQWDRAHATEPDRQGSNPGWAIPNIWKAVFATFPASCSALMSGCKGRLRVRPYHWPAPNDCECSHWNPAQGSGHGSPRPLVTLQREYKECMMKLFTLSNGQYHITFHNLFAFSSTRLPWEGRLLQW